MEKKQQTNDFQYDVHGYDTWITKLIRNEMFDFLPLKEIINIFPLITAKLNLLKFST